MSRPSSPIVATVLTLLTALAGCDRTDATPTPSPVVATTKPATMPLTETPPVEAPPVEVPAAPDHVRAATVLVSTAEALGELHVRHTDRCSALAEAIEGFYAEHGATLAQAAPEVHAHIDADDELRSRMRTAMEPVMTVSMACRRDPAFAAMQAKLLRTPEPPAASPRSNGLP
jgi:hypothetical protein